MVFVSYFDTPFMRKDQLRQKMTEVKPAELIFICFMLLHGKAGQGFDYSHKIKKQDHLLTREQGSSVNSGPVEWDLLLNTK